MSDADSIVELHKLRKEMEKNYLALLDTELAKVKSQQVTITELEADSVHGWRSCIDHIIKPESACPVCKIESLQATITELREELKGIAAREGCFNNINGCVAAQAARAALKEKTE